VGAAGGAYDDQRAEVFPAGAGAPDTNVVSSRWTYTLQLDPVRAQVSRSRWSARSPW
jgi:hypothetical protein